MLAAASQSTRRIALTALVLCNEFRNPTVLAQEVRTMMSFRTAGSNWGWASAG